eukprot:scaffold2058_cov115-Isochrysis_galbana.AAC.9
MEDGRGWELGACLVPPNWLRRGGEAREGALAALFTIKDAGRSGARQQAASAVAVVTSFPTRKYAALARFKVSPIYNSISLSSLTRHPRPRHPALTHYHYSHASNMCSHMQIKEAIFSFSARASPADAGGLAPPHAGSLGLLTGYLKFPPSSANP